MYVSNVNDMKLFKFNVHTVTKLINLITVKIFYFHFFFHGIIYVTSL